MEENIKDIEKNRKRKTICLVSIVILIVAIVGTIIIIKANSNPIIGKWCYSEGKAWCYEFNEDMTGSYGMSNNKNNLTYRIDENIIHVEYENNSMTMEDTKFRVENDILIFTNSKGEEITYNKEEPKEQPRAEAEKTEEDIERDEELRKRKEEMLKELEEEQD